MVERVSLFGGTLSHRVTGDGRFELTVTLPLSGGPCMTSVVVADDREVVRTGLHMVLEARGCDVVGLAGDGREAVEMVRRTRPDVVLMDIRMPVLDGIAATREITASGVASRVLVLTTYDLNRYVYGAFKAGAAGVSSSSCSPTKPGWRGPATVLWKRAAMLDP